MYKPPVAYTDLVRAIDHAPETWGRGAVLVGVELVLTLAEDLGLGDEPITVGWALLTGTPMPNEALRSLTADQRWMVAHARQFIPFNSRFAWEAALKTYAQIERTHRNYDIAVTHLDEQIINARKIDPLPHPEYIDSYRNMLTEPLAFKQAAQRRPESNKFYTVVITTENGVQRGRVRFDASHIQHLEKLLGKPWIGGERTRKPFKIRLKALRQTAKFLDRREEALGNRAHWVNDLARIQFQRVDGDGVSARLCPDDELIIDGFFHLAGIVSSGKTTLAILLAAYIMQHKLPVRITLVVGDTSTVVQLAHRFNVWFRKDPALDHPVAVPILGQSTHGVHIQRMLTSGAYQTSKAHGQSHWGERWLSPVCPLQPLVEWEQPEAEPIPAGREPCQRLQAANRAGKNVSVESQYVKNYLCPLFAICPSKQLYRDMPEANLWITTPGALSQSAVPRQLEARPIKIGDLVYEQSDLVIFDEAETIVDWFDRVYAQNLELTNGATGLLDRLDVEVTNYLRERRAPSIAFQRWVFAERAATKAVTGVLTCLDSTQGQGLELIRKWVRHRGFTRNSLTYRLSRRLAGLKEYEARTDLPLAQQREQQQQTQAVLQIFEELARLDNPLSLQVVPPVSREQQAAYALTEIMQAMNSAGLDVDMLALIRRCDAWIERFFPDIEMQLTALKVQLEGSDSKVDRAYAKQDQLDRNRYDLALRLFFTLWVVVLDWHINIVFHEWHTKPPEINVEQPYSKIPHYLRNILPIPAPGALYGLYHVPKRPTPDNANRLSQFVHLNIGRAYVLNFHQLRSDLDGQRGPNVLAMSGTSYLPASSRFNLQKPPRGVLSPDTRTQQALQQCHFEFKPFYDDKGHPIRVSGVSRKDTALGKMARAMVTDSGLPGGFLGRILGDLRQKADVEPDQWADRARILLFTNSYKQARTVAYTLQKLWPEMAQRIYYLCKGRDDQDYEVSRDEDTSQHIQKVDIEQFAKKDGVILVAPMQSIGRGFNILNRQQPPLAAFGAVVFLMRYMWQPEDMVALAQEIDRYTIQWADLIDVPLALEGADGLYKTAITLRDVMHKLSRNIELRYGYESLNYAPADGDASDLDLELRISPRRDLAATTAGLIIQAVGRLLRGGVLFQAYFTDAAWAPKTAQHGRTITEFADTSLLQAVIDVLNDYADEKDVVGYALYHDLADAISCTVGLNNN
jgi:hypothetical protein